MVFGMLFVTKLTNYKYVKFMDRIMKNIFHLLLKVALPLLFVVACTQFLEETETSQAYDGTDGCIYCHTNKARLQVLAQEEEGGSADGG